MTDQCHDWNLAHVDRGSAKKEGMAPRRHANCTCKLQIKHHLWRDHSVASANNRHKPYLENSLKKSTLVPFFASVWKTPRPPQNQEDHVSMKKRSDNSVTIPSSSHVDSSCATVPTLMKLLKTLPPRALRCQSLLERGMTTHGRRSDKKWRCMGTSVVQSPSTRQRGRY